jgi:hypothetical protein
VESAYIDVAKKFIAEDGGSALRACGVEKSVFLSSSSPHPIFKPNKTEL